MSDLPAPKSRSLAALVMTTSGISFAAINKAQRLRGMDGAVEAAPLQKRFMR
jgi:hypothetical protein